MLIRQMKTGDYQAVSDLIRAELGYSQLDTEQFASRMTAMKNHPDYMTLVAADENQVLGFIGLAISMAYEFEGNYARIIALAVDQKYHNQGIGSALLAYAEKWAAQQGISLLFLNSGLKRNGAHAFYEKCGFIKQTHGFEKNL